MADYNLVKTAVDIDAALNQVDTNTASLSTKLNTSDALTPVSGSNKLLTEADGGGGGGSGDMLKSVYDTNNNGVVDNAALVNGLSVQAAVPAGAAFTDTVYDDSAVLKDADALTTVNAGNKLITQSDVVTTRYPLVTQNVISPPNRFPDSNDFGTGVSSTSIETDINGIKKGILAFDSGSLGRSFFSSTVTIDAGQWYCFSIEITLEGLTGATGSGVTNGTATAILDNGELEIPSDKISLSGAGRYFTCFMSLLGGTINPRVGVGISSNKTNESFTIKDMQLEKIDSERGLICTPYVYPLSSAAFNYLNHYSADENNKITEYTKNYFNTIKYSNIIIMGDSRSDEKDKDIAAKLQALYLDQVDKVNISVHAHGGWKTSHIIGPTVVGTITHNYLSVLDGNAHRQSFVVDEQENQLSNEGYAYDTMIICDFGVNDISVGDPLGAVAPAMVNINTICLAAIDRGMDIIITDNNPWNANVNWNADKQEATIELNRLLMNYCAENGHIFVSIYSELGDSTDPDKLSDGGGTTPDYSADGLHMNDAGSLLVANIIKRQMDAARG